MKMLAMDIDGTLINKGPLDAKVISALSTLKKDGWEIIIATGRSYFSSLEVIRAIEPYYLGIFADGAQIRDISDNRIIQEKCLSSETANTILSVIWYLPVEIQVFHSDIVVCRKGDLKTIDYFRSIDVEVLPQLKESYLLNWNPMRVMLYGSNQVLKRAESDLNSCTFLSEEDVHVTWAGEHFIDILPSGVSKGNAFHDILAMEKTEPQITVAVGDHINDLEIMQSSDFCVCPSHAHHIVRSVSQLSYPSDPSIGIPKLVKFLMTNKIYSKNLINRLKL